MSVVERQRRWHSAKPIKPTGSDGHFPVGGIDTTTVASSCRTGSHAILPENNSRQVTDCSPLRVSLPKVTMSYGRELSPPQLASLVCEGDEVAAMSFGAFSPPRSSSQAAASFKSAATKLSSMRSMLSSPMTSPSGRSTPVKLEMSVTEQIARKSRKSTVLDDKNALLILAIPDYDEYKILQPYSCRTLTNRNKFVGGRDFITRHNPQEVDDFKKQYSRDVGNLNRHRSVVSPPGSTLMAAGLLTGTSASTLSLDSLPSPGISSKIGSNNSEEIWKRAYTASQKVCWVLTEFGIERLIGPEYRMTTRLSVLPQEKALSPPRSVAPFSCRRPVSPPMSALSGSESARVGSRVNLLDEKTLGGLTRTAAYSPASRPPTSPARCPSRSGFTDYRLSKETPSMTSPSRPLYIDTLNQPLSPALAPTTPSFHSAFSHSEHLRSPLVVAAAAASTSNAGSPTTRPFAMEIAPPIISLGTLQIGEVYLFPVRIRNVGFKQERFRVRKVEATCNGFEAALAEATFDKDTARLAAGLAGIVTLALSFRVAGRVNGALHIETEAAGESQVSIKAVVR